MALMTRQEIDAHVRFIQSLAVGDVIECWRAGRWVACVVCDRYVLHGGGFLVYARTDGRTAAGALYPRWRCQAHHRPRLCVRRDPVDANVYADWLEEQGHAAAAALRKAFPLDAKKEAPR